MTYDLAIVDGLIVSGTATEVANLIIDGGKVIARTAHNDHVDVRTRISARGQLVFPGLVDVHVHFREPGAAYKEGFESGTRAAAVGGVTTVMVMPTDNPLTLTPSDYESKVKLAEKRSYVDYAILAQLGSDFSQLDALADLGVLSFEIFFAGQSAAGKLSDNALLIDALEQISHHGIVAGITPGDDDIIRTRTQALQSAGRHDPRAFALSRPPIAEALGVARACLTAAETGARVHVRQISCAASVTLLQFWKLKSSHISAEVMPHNLLLTEDDLARLGPFAKMAPPLRSAEERDSLWKGLREGIIDAIATDHAPHLKSEKDLGREDIWQAPLGVPGLQTCLPLLLGEAARGALTYEQIVRFTSEAPARTFGIFPRKGALVSGSDADLVIVDPNRTLTIRNTDQLSKAQVTPFDGWTVKGAPTLTMLRGGIVMDSNLVVGVPRGALVSH